MSTVDDALNLLEADGTVASLGALPSPPAGDDEEEPVSPPPFTEAAQDPTLASIEEALALLEEPDYQCVEVTPKGPGRWEERGAGKQESWAAVKRMYKAQQLIQKPGNGAFFELWKVWPTDKARSKGDVPYYFKVLRNDLLQQSQAAHQRALQMDKTQQDALRYFGK